MRRNALCVSFELYIIQIRNTWASYIHSNPSLDNLIRIIFIVGKQKNNLRIWSENIDNQVAQESEKYGDILHVDIIDAYVNITAKSMAIFEWIITKCSNAQFLMKLDDDVFINIEILLKEINLNYDINSKNVNFISKASPLAESFWKPLFRPFYSHAHPIEGTSFKSMKIHEKSFIKGHVIYNPKPIRKEFSKWYIPSKIYSHEDYGFDYIAGCGALMPLRVAKLIYAVSSCLNNLLFIDDIFLFGYIPSLLGIQLIDLPNVFDDTKNANIPKSKHDIKSFQENLLVAQLEPTELKELWKILN